MSTEGALFSLREELKLVSEELAKLSLRVSRLSQNLSALEAVPAAPEWEVVEEGTLPIGVSDISRPYPGAPESPHSPVPKVPRYLLNLCQEKLKATSSTTPKERAERAFAQGHEAWSAIQTGGFYRPASAVPNLPSSHWVILRGLGLEEPVRTTSRREALRFLLRRDDSAIIEDLPIFHRGSRLLHRSSCVYPSLEAMRKAALRFAEVGEPSLLVFSIPSEISKSGDNEQVFALPILSRDSGFLIAVPIESFSHDALLAAQSADDQDLIGPSHVCVAGLCEEDDSGAAVQLDQETHVLLIDVSDLALEALREYDPVTDSLEDIQTFEDTFPAALPVSAALTVAAKTWAEEVGHARLNFYSAREEQEYLQLPAKQSAATKKAPAKRMTNAALSEQVTLLAAQVQALASLQEQQRVPTRAPVTSAGDAQGLSGGGGRGPYPQMPPLSQSFAKMGPPRGQAVQKVAALLGPPPKTRQKANPAALEDEKTVEEPSDPFAASSDPVLAALSQQSSALTSLVAHLTAHNADPLLDLQPGGGSGSSSSTRGVARRERMQSDLALRQSQ